MTTAAPFLPSRSVSRSPVPSPTATIHDARPALIVASIARLRLPPFPMRLIGGQRLSPTDQRCKAALAVFNAVRDTPGDATIPSIAKIVAATKLDPRDVRQAERDLAHCRVLIADGHSRSLTTGVETTYRLGVGQ